MTLDGGTTVRSRVEALLVAAPEARDGVTHDGLIALYRKYGLRLGWPPASESSIRTRCNELVRDGKAHQVRDMLGKSRGGRHARLWRASIVHFPETAILDGGA